METRIKYLCLWLCLVCIVVFIIQMIVPGFTAAFMLTKEAPVKVWQFFTAIFLHGSIVHLLYNLFALFLFGVILERLIGSRRFLLLFFLSGIFANLIAYWWYPNSLGASGGIMAILGTVAVLEPMMTVWAFSLPMPMFVLAVLWTVGSILGIFGFGDQNTGYWAHLAGIVIGIIYGFYLRIFIAEQRKIILDKKEEPLISEDYVRFWEDHHLKK